MNEMLTFTVVILLQLLPIVWVAVILILLTFPEDSVFYNYLERILPVDEGAAAAVFVAGGAQLFLWVLFAAGSTGTVFLLTEVAGYTARVWPFFGLVVVVVIGVYTLLWWVNIVLTKLRDKPDRMDEVKKLVREVISDG